MRRTHVLCLAAALALLAPAARADEKDDLKKEIQQLNNQTGDGKVIDSVKDLLKDKAHLAKLLKEAEEMAKLDSKSFKYNGAYILALAAAQVKDYDSAVRLFKICEKQAKDQKSATKMAEAFEGHFAVLYETKRYEAAENLCRDFIDAPGSEELEGIKLLVVAQLVQVMTKQGKVEDALKLADKMTKNEDIGWYYYPVKGWVLHEAGRDEESAKVYLEAIEQFEKNETLKPEQQE